MSAIPPKADICSAQADVCWARSGHFVANLVPTKRAACKERVTDKRPTDEDWMLAEGASSED